MLLRHGILITIITNFGFLLFLLFLVGVINLGLLISLACKLWKVNVLEDNYNISALTSDL
jgi:hypothetical protein